MLNTVESHTIGVMTSCNMMIVSPTLQFYPQCSSGVCPCVAFAPWYLFKARSTRGYQHTVRVTEDGVCVWVCGGGDGGGGGGLTSDG